jgi:hypothetical protein
MCAQLWVPKAEVGGGEGLELVVVEGRVRPRPGCEHRSGYPTRALASTLSPAELAAKGGKFVTTALSAGAAEHLLAVANPLSPEELVAKPFKFWLPWPLPLRWCGCHGPYLHLKQAGVGWLHHANQQANQAIN